MKLNRPNNLQVTNDRSQKKHSFVAVLNDFKYIL